MVEDALIGSIKVIGLCPNCGKAIPARKGSGRRRIFCSERCRSKYARQHPSPTSQENVREHRCEYCGGLFILAQKGGKVGMVQRGWQNRQTGWIRFYIRH